MIKNNKILMKVINLVEKNEPEAEIYLYGLRARCNAKKFSDWDILILLSWDKISFNDETKFMNEIYEIELETGEVISPLFYTKKDWNENHSYTSFYENIKNEGIRIK